MRRSYRSLLTGIFFIILKIFSLTKIFLATYNEIALNGVVKRMVLNSEEGGEWVTKLRPIQGQ